MSQHNKSRNLPMLDYLDALQKEYVIAEVRKKIYHKPKDKAYYKKVMEGKKNKIIDITTRNALPDIFTDSVIKENYYTELLGDKYPKFIYRDEEEEAELGPLDRYNYYSKGKDVKIINDKESPLYGQIVFSDFENQVCRVKLRYENEERLFPFKDVIRIL